MKPDIARSGESRTRPPKAPIRRICIFHNDGERLYAFPDTWQGAYDFLVSKDQFVLPVSNSNEYGASANRTVWGRELRERVDFHYTGNSGPVAFVSIGNDAWGLNNLRIEPNTSLCFMMVGGKPKACRFQQ